MKFINVQQGSPEWKELRRTKIGASMCPIIMEADPYTTRYQLWQQMMQGTSVEENPSMKAGKAMEPEARAIMGAKHGVEYIYPVVQHDTREWQIASLDGLSTDKSRLLEIKHTLSNELLDKVEKGHIPERWEWQLQHILSVTELSHITLFVRDFSGMFTFEILVARDEVMIKELIEEEYKYYTDHILGFEPPEMVAKDYVQRIDTEWANWAAKAAKHKKAADIETKEYEAARTVLIGLSGDQSCMGGGIKLRRSDQPGNIDYKAIPELKDIDVEKYRKKGYTKWTLSLIS